MTTEDRTSRYCGLVFAHQKRRRIPCTCVIILILSLLITLPASAGSEPYTMTNLGAPEGAYSIVGVRMNNFGHVAGWSQYFDQGEPSLRGWVWTPEDGFTILPPPPGFFLGRSRAIDINDSGVVAGDGGFDIGLAWRYEDGTYEVTGSVEGMGIAYLGGINEAGDIAGTAKDATIVTPDYAWLDINGGALLSLTPNGGRATDLNNNGQVCGYTNEFSTPAQAFRWDADNDVQLLGTLGLARSFAHRMNDAGDIVGVASSASGNTNRAWIYTDEGGMELLPAPYLNASTAVAINNSRHVLGISAQSGLDFNWLWTGGDSVTNVNTLFDFAGANINLIAVRDINNNGQILAQVFDNNIPDFRMVILTPPSEPMPGDIDGSGTVDVQDLLALLAAWGPCDGGPCREDLDDNGVVNVSDLLMLLANWS